MKRESDGLNSHEAKEYEIDLWLDDMRPAPSGWVHVKTAQEAIALLEGGNVRKCSLDHDLGACAECCPMSPEEWLIEHSMQSMPHCDHFGTGYTVVCWMEETGKWPMEKPTVHSANPVGRSKMLTTIERYYSRIASTRK